MPVIPGVMQEIEKRRKAEQDARIARANENAINQSKNYGNMASTLGGLGAIAAQRKQEETAAKAKAEADDRIGKASAYDPNAPGAGPQQSVASMGALDPNDPRSKYNPNDPNSYQTQFGMDRDVVQANPLDAIQQEAFLQLRRRPGAVAGVDLSAANYDKDRMRGNYQHAANEMFADPRMQDAYSQGIGSLLSNSAMDRGDLGAGAAAAGMQGAQSEFKNALRGLSTKGGQRNLGQLASMLGGSQQGQAMLDRGSKDQAELMARRQGLIDNSFGLMGRGAQDASQRAAQRASMGDAVAARDMARQMAERDQNLRFEAGLNKQLAGVLGISSEAANSILQNDQKKRYEDAARREQNIGALIGAGGQLIGAGMGV